MKKKVNSDMVKIVTWTFTKNGIACHKIRYEKTSKAKDTWG